MAKKRKARVGSREWLALDLAYKAACKEKKRLLDISRRREPSMDEHYLKSQIRDCERIIEYAEERIGENAGDDIHDDFDK